MAKRPPRSGAFRFVVAVLAVAMAALIRFALTPIWGAFDRPLILFFLAVVFTAWYGRWGAAVVAIILGSLVANFFFLQPSLSFQPESLKQWTLLILFITASTGIVLMVEQMHRVTERAQCEAEQRRRSEMALHDSERLLRTARDEALAANAAKDRFLAVLSHELRTPLSPILLLASEHVNDETLPEDVRRAFDMILKNASMEVHLIDDLLDLSRIIHGKLVLHRVPAEIHSILRESVELVSGEIAAKRLKVSVQLDAPYSSASADPLRLKQVFANVLRNAVKFTPGDGAITIRSELTSHGAGLLLTIADTGIGMNEEEIKRAFTPFAQGDHAAAGMMGSFGGLGLGLAIAKQLVEGHGGSIGLESGGRGTVVSLRLPVEPPVLKMEVAPFNHGQRTTV